jgi:hypothetical protein
MIYHFCGTSSLVSLVVYILVLSFLGLLQQQLFSSATFIRSFHNHEYCCNNNNNIVHPNYLLVLQSSQLSSSSSEEEEKELSSSSSTSTKTAASTTLSPRIQHHNTSEELPIFQEISGPFQPHLFTNSWTKHPLLIRNAFPSTSSWPTIQEIQTLATEEEEEDVEVRRITQLSSTYYELTIGGYDPSTDYNNKSVVLIVNDVDRFLPTLSDWISETFSFLPAWRIDDGQMSYSPKKGATIGRHVDNYDVFCKLFLSPHTQKKE